MLDDSKGTLNINMNNGIQACTIKYPKLTIMMVIIDKVTIYCASQTGKYTRKIGKYNCLKKI